MTKRKILILTQPLHTNYGGLLQAYALQKVLRELGFDVVTNKTKRSFKRTTFVKGYLKWLVKIVLGRVFKIKRFASIQSRIMSKKIYNVVSQNTEEFIEKYIHYTYFTDSSHSVLDKGRIQDFDIFVVGSDQVWTKSTYTSIEINFLAFVPEDKVKISYAASFGSSDVIKSYSELDLSIAKGSLSNFVGVSVRESSAVRLCKEYLGVDSVHHIDPTMLLEVGDYLELIDDEDLNDSEKVLMTYVLDKSTTKNEIIDRISSHHYLEVLEVMPKETFGESFFQNVEDCIYPSVSKWIAGFRDAQFVVTDSFHGTVFAMLFNKPFISIVNYNRGSDRFSSLLEMFNLDNRLVNSIEEVTDELLAEKIDYTFFNEHLSLQKRRSKEYFMFNLMNQQNAK